MKSLQKFYKNKKILVTGHTGFKGAYLSIWLNKLGSKVYGLSLPENKMSIYRQCKIKKIFKNKNQYQDIRNLKKYREKILKINPNIIFHMAAQPIVKNAYDNPIGTLETNILGTANTINIARELKSLKCLIIITTDKCYKNIKKKGYTEEDILGGYDPYSSSKACAELVTDSMRSSFFKNTNIHISTARAGNVVGGGDWSDKRLIPDIAKSIKYKKKLIIRNPSFVRPWQHILDLLYGYLILASKPKNFSGAWNFGPTKHNITVLNFVKKILKNFNKKLIIIKKKENFKETSILNLNISKSKKYLKWKPKFNIELTAKLTAEWYKKSFNLTGDKLYEFTLKQINFYEKLIK